MNTRWVNLMLVRHTESVDNAGGMYSGQRGDVRLTPLGERQADDLAALLAAHAGDSAVRSKRSLAVRAVVSSDLERAIDVARRIVASCNCTLLTDERLREVHIGEMDGIPITEGHDRYPISTLRCGHPAFDFRPIGGESCAEVLYRVCVCLDEIAGRFGTFDKLTDDAVVIVGHGTALRVLLKHFDIVETLHEQGAFQILRYGLDADGTRHAMLLSHDVP